MTTVLQFSGGKDSLACLYLLKEYWDKIIVLWVNTGACYPETLEQMENIKKMVPHFVEVKSDQPSHIEEYGLPSDLVPIANTEIGIACSGEDNIKIHAWSDCCRMNLWEPMQNATKSLGATTVIRGQRGDDLMKSPIKSGTEYDGIKYIFPLQDWSQDDVIQYLDSIGVDLPEYYEWSDTSLDCWNCTAFVGERHREISNMKHVHPEMWEVYRPMLESVLIEVDKERENILGAIHGADAHTG